MEWTELGGVGLRHELSGGDGKVLVLVHEMGCTLESFDLVLPLLEPDMTLLRFDTRGAGLSTKLRGTAQISDMAGDIAALLVHHDIDRPVTITGGAVGGAIALHFAAAYPELTGGAVLFGPATGVVEERQQAILDHADHVERAGMAAIVDAELGRAYPESLRGNAARFQRFRARWLANDPGSYAAIYRMLAGLDMAAEIAAIRCPTLLLAGHADPLRPPETIEPLSRRIAGSRFQAIDSGHFAATQTPDLVAQILNAFITEIAA